MFAVEDKGPLVCHEGLAYPTPMPKGVFSVWGKKPRLHTKISECDKNRLFRPCPPSTYSVSSHSLCLSLCHCPCQLHYRGVPALIAIKDQTFMNPSGTYVHKCQLSLIPTPRAVKIVLCPLFPALPPRIENSWTSAPPFPISTQGAPAWFVKVTQCQDASGFTFHLRWRPGEPNSALLGAERLLTAKTVRFNQTADHSA